MAVSVETIQNCRAEIEILQCDKKIIIYLISNLAETDTETNTGIYTLNILFYPVPRPMVQSSNLDVLFFFLDPQDLRRPKFEPRFSAFYFSSLCCLSVFLIGEAVWEGSKRTAMQQGEKFLDKWWLVPQLYRIKLYSTRYKEIKDSFLDKKQPWTSCRTTWNFNNVHFS